MKKHVLKQINPKYSLETSEFVKPNPLDLLRFCKKTSPDGDEIYEYVTDTKLLLNAQRIRNVLGEDTYLDLCRAMNKAGQSSGVYAQDIEKPLTDKQLMYNIKSRYIQQPSETRAWINELMAQAEDIRLAQAQAQEQAQAQAQERAWAQAQAQALSQSFAQSKPSE